MFPGPFRPAWPLGSRHLQTLWPVLFRRRSALALRRERWSLPDGDTLSVHFAQPAPVWPAHQGPAPAVLVVHGLEGSVRSQYVRGLLQRVSEQGWRGVAFDLRSCGLAPGDPPNRTAYHAGKTDDLHHVAQRLRSRFHQAPLAVVGFSLGGNILLKWLGELGPAAPVTAAVAVSAPFDLAACAAAIDRPGFWNALYRQSFMKSLRNKALALAAAGPDPGADAVTGDGSPAPRLDRRRILACRTFAEFDGQVTARLFGFADAGDYWARCSARGYLAGIRRPSLLIAASDDPFVPAEAIPRALIASNPALRLWLTERGGHVGFVGGSLRRPRYAAEEACVGFLRQHLVDLTSPPGL